MQQTDSGRTTQQHYASSHGCHLCGGIKMICMLLTVMTLFGTIKSAFGSCVLILPHSPGSECHQPAVFIPSVEPLQAGLFIQMKNSFSKLLPHTLLCCLSMLLPYAFFYNLPFVITHPSRASTVTCSRGTTG